MVSERNDNNVHKMAVPGAGPACPAVPSGHNRAKGIKAIHAGEFLLHHGENSDQMYYTI